MLRGHLRIASSWTHRQSPTLLRAGGSTDHRVESLAHSVRSDSTAVRLPMCLVRSERRTVALRSRCYSCRYVQLYQLPHVCSVTAECTLTSLSQNSREARDLKFISFCLLTAGAFRAAARATFVGQYKECMSAWIGWVLSVQCPQARQPPNGILVHRALRPLWLM